MWAWKTYPNQPEEHPPAAAAASAAGASQASVFSIHSDATRALARFDEESAKFKAARADVDRVTDAVVKQDAAIKRAASRVTDAKRDLDGAASRKERADNAQRSVHEAEAHHRATTSLMNAAKDMNMAIVTLRMEEEVAAASIAGGGLSIALAAPSAVQKAQSNLSATRIIFAKATAAPNLTAAALSAVKDNANNPQECFSALCGAATEAGEALRSAKTAYAALMQAAPEEPAVALDKARSAHAAALEELRELEKQKAALAQQVGLATARADAARARLDEASRNAAAQRAPGVTWLQKAREERQAEIARLTRLLAAHDIAQEACESIWSAVAAAATAQLRR